MKKMLYLMPLIVIFFQNCDSINITRITSNNNKSSICSDEDKNLTLVKYKIPSQNSELSFFQIFELDDNQNILKPFTPDFNETSWPPEWRLNGLNPNLADGDVLLSYEDVNGVIFGSNIEDCNQEYTVTAKILLCGTNPIQLQETYIAPRCMEPVQCNEFGVTANVGDVKSFYSSSSVACSMQCSEIKRECLPNGSFSQPLSPHQNENTLDYVHSDCIPDTACPVVINPTNGSPIGNGSSSTNLGTPGATFSLDITRNQSSSFYFSTNLDGVETYAEINVGQPPPIGFKARVLFSLSNVPYDFQEMPLGQSGCRSLVTLTEDSGSGLIFLTTKSSSARPFNCLIEKNRAYYFNYYVSNQDCESATSNESCMNAGFTNQSYHFKSVGN